MRAPGSPALNCEGMTFPAITEDPDMETEFDAIAITARLLALEQLVVTLVRASPEARLLLAVTPELDTARAVLSEMPPGRSSGQQNQAVREAWIELLHKLRQPLGS